MTEHGAKLYVKQMVTSIVNVDQWARAVEYVVIQRSQGRSFKTIAELLAIDNPFNTVTEAC
jgi:hypothetical protein